MHFLHIYFYCPCVLNDLDFIVVLVDLTIETPYVADSHTFCCSCLAFIEFHCSLNN